MRAAGADFGSELAQLCLQCVKSFECADHMSHHDVPERDGDPCFVSSSPCRYCQCPLREWMKPVQYLASEVEQVKKVANGRRVGWGIVADRRIVRRVFQVIAAAAGDRRQAPVVFDELQNRNMV